MTPHLHVQVRLHGAVVEDRLMEVCGQAWLGECDGAAVSFPGAIVSVQSAAGELWTRGERLVPGAPAVRSWGPVELRLEAAIPERLPRDWSCVPDPMLLVATVALMLAGAFVDTLSAELGAAREEQLARSVNSVEERYREPAPLAEVSSETWAPTATYASSPE